MSSHDSTTNQASPRNLHIGGNEVKNDWEIFNIIDEPYVDHVGNAKDMSAFEDASFDTLYASHVLEHFDYFSELEAVLDEWYRILKPGGKLYISVPDIEVLGQLLADDTLSFMDRFKVMRMMFGGQSNPYDFHKVGFNLPILKWYLRRSGFDMLHRVDEFGMFKDSSSKRHMGRLISLNLIAHKAL